MTSIVNVDVKDSLAATTALKITFVKIDSTLNLSSTVATNTIVSNTFFKSGVSPLSSAAGLTSSAIGISLFRRVGAVT